MSTRSKRTASSSAPSQYGKGRGSDSLHVRSKNDWHTLCSEFNLCKRKLEAKKEALLILAKELDMVRQEKEAYQLMAEQLREKFQAQRKKYEERERSLGLSLNESDPLSERRNHSLIQVLCEARQQTKKSEAEIADLHQKLAEAHGDIKLLRENIARQRVGDDDLGARHFPAHERKELVQQLEEVKEQLETLQRDMVAKIDEQEEVVTERDFFRDKGDRLNQELNYVLGGDERRIVDIDALIMENKYLKERLKQCQEEKSMAQNTVAKYKSALEKRRGKGTLKLGATTSGGLVISQKQVEKLLAEGRAGTLPATQSSLSDLRSLASTLLETVHDKNMALNHQRNTNKILGQRVAELEKKLKTLEIAGLWNLPPGTEISNIACCMVGTGKGSTFADLEKERMQAGITSLIPRQISDASEVESSSKSDGVGGGGSGLSSVNNSTHNSPAHKGESQGDAESLISLDENNVKGMDERLPAKVSSPKKMTERASSLDSYGGRTSSVSSNLSLGNPSDLLNGEQSLKDLLGDCDEQQSLSTDLDISPERYKMESVFQMGETSKDDEILIPPVPKTKQYSKEEITEEEDGRLVSLEDTSSDSHLLQLDSNAEKVDPIQDEQSAEHESEGVEEDTPSLYAEEDNLKKISAVIEEANEQQDDVYIVDIQDDDDEYDEDYEDEDDCEIDRFVPEEEATLLTSQGEPTIPSDAEMEEKDMEHFEGFFEGVADRIASKNLEKSMGVSSQGVTNPEEGQVGAEEQQHISSSASPLIPKEKAPRPLTVSGEEVDSLPQCV